MMNMKWCLAATLCAASACVPAAFAQSSASATNPLPRWVLVQVARTAAVKWHGRCNDTLFSFFPGRLDYCLGLHDLKRGHYSTGLQFLHLAAGWGNKYAQYSLGLVYFNGHHVPANRPLGLAWLMLANQRRNDQQTERVTRSVKHLATPEQRQRARALYTQMLSKYGDDVAAQRAWERFQHARQSSFADTFVGPDGMNCFSLSLHVAAVQGSCLSSRGMLLALRTVAGNYFNGWNGVVTVSPLKQVDAPAASKNK